MVRNEIDGHLGCEVEYVDLVVGDHEGVDLQVGEEQVHVEPVQRSHELGHAILWRGVQV